MLLILSRLVVLFYKNCYLARKTLCPLQRPSLSLSLVCHSTTVTSEWCGYLNKLQQRHVRTDSTRSTRQRKRGWWGTASEREREPSGLRFWHKTLRSLEATTEAIIFIICDCMSEKRAEIMLIKCRLKITIRHDNCVNYWPACKWVVFARPCAFSGRIYLQRCSFNCSSR